MSGIRCRGKPEPPAPARPGPSTAGIAGFTLIELLIVVLIVGLLAAIAIPRLDDLRARAHLTTIGQDFRNLGAAQERYYQSQMQYAGALSDLDFAPSEGVDVEVTEATNSGWGAIGTHQALEEGRGCSVYFGDAVAPALPGGQAHGAGPGAVECSR